MRHVQLDAVGTPTQPGRRLGADPLRARARCRRSPPPTRTDRRRPRTNAQHGASERVRRRGVRRRRRRSARRTCRRAGRCGSPSRRPSCSPPNDAGEAVLVEQARGGGVEVGDGEDDVVEAQHLRMVRRRRGRPAALVRSRRWTGSRDRRPAATADRRRACRSPRCATARGTRPSASAVRTCGARRARRRVRRPCSTHRAAMRDRRSRVGAGGRARDRARAGRPRRARRPRRVGTAACTRSSARSTGATTACG